MWGAIYPLKELGQRAITFRDTIQRREGELEDLRRALQLLNLGPNQRGAGKPIVSDGFSFLFHCLKMASLTAIGTIPLVDKWQSQTAMAIQRLELQVFFNC